MLRCLKHCSTELLLRVGLLGGAIRWGYWVGLLGGAIGWGYWVGLLGGAIRWGLLGGAIRCCVNVSRFMSLCSVY